ncbi:unnamed protein product [Ilex paraguariensis]|uniref:Uncharacterized protein n=1 Tax=Ilex paraguariensis TaxID=185542 RepID=A0ABC8SKG2_9AQUA
MNAKKKPRSSWTWNNLQFGTNLLEKEELGRRSLLYSLLMLVMNQFVPGLDKSKGMYFLFIKSEAKTLGGLLARPVLTSYYKSSYSRQRPYDPYTNYTSPNETILCSDSYQSMYSQILCGLCVKAAKFF